MLEKLKYMIAFTGHRPPKIGGYDFTSPLRIAVRNAIKVKLQSAMTKYQATHEIVVISGGALGVDQDAAMVAYDMGLPYIVAAPCLNQDIKWPASSKLKYLTLIAHAQEVVYVHNGSYNATCMQNRNVWMVDHCDALIAVWDGSSGGTANCVRYAESVNKPIVRINPQELSI